MGSAFLPRPDDRCQQQDTARYATHLQQLYGVHVVGGTDLCGDSSPAAMRHPCCQGVRSWTLASSGQKARSLRNEGQDSCLIQRTGAKGEILRQLQKPGYSSLRDSCPAAPELQDRALYATRFRAVYASMLLENEVGFRRVHRTGAEGKILQRLRRARYSSLRDSPPAPTPPKDKLQLFA